jgi:hypothetical protein
MSKQKISPARIYLLLMFIICFSSMLALALIIGKTGKFDQQGISNPATSPASSPNVIEKGIIITTDKMEYEPAEAIKVAVENNTSNDLYLLSSNIRFKGFQIKENNDWVNVKSYLLLGMLPRLDKKIPAKSKITEDVYPDFFVFSGEYPSSDKYYRFAETVYFQCNKNADLEDLDGCSKKTIYSNAFKFKEKITTVPAVPVDFYSCSADSDCVSVKADCCGCTAGGKATAISKNFIDQWKNNCNATEPVVCPAVMSDDPSCINKIPQCVDNKCVLK